MCLHALLVSFSVHLCLQPSKKSVRDYVTQILDSIHRTICGKALSNFRKLVKFLRKIKTVKKTNPIHVYNFRFYQIQIKRRLNLKLAMNKLTKWEKADNLWAATSWAKKNVFKIFKSPLKLQWTSLVITMIRAYSARKIRGTATKTKLEQNLESP